MLREEEKCFQFCIWSAFDTSVNSDQRENGFVSISVLSSALWYHLMHSRFNFISLKTSEFLDLRLEFSRFGLTPVCPPKCVS